MSGHGANPIFVNKKNKEWTSRTLANPPPPTSDNISFCLIPPSLSKWTSYVYHPLLIMSFLQSFQEYFSKKDLDYVWKIKKNFKIR